MMWGEDILDPVLFALTNGRAYWLLMCVLYGYVFALICDKDQPLFSPHNVGMIITRTAMIIMFGLLTSYAFAYRLFPLIPAEKGGGNHTHSRDALLCFPAGPKSEVIVQLLSTSKVTPNCLGPLKVVAATDSLLYITTSSGQRPEFSGEVRGFPTIYSVAKSDLAGFLTNPSRVQTK
jgi:hypothetical protein